MAAARHSGTGLLPVALVALLAGLTFWLDRTTRGDEGARPGQRRHDPDYIVERFQLRRFDADGALQHSLVANKMLHYPDDDSTQVIEPRLTYHRIPPTHLAADRARLDSKGENVTLEGNVRIVRQGNGDRLETRITTSVLHVVPEAEVARTAAPVTLTMGNSVIKGNGLEANNRTRSAVMSGPVRGTIYPKQSSPANSPQ